MACMNLSWRKAKGKLLQTYSSSLKMYGEQSWSSIYIFWWENSVAKQTSSQANLYEHWAPWYFQIMSTYNAARAWLSLKLQREVCYDSKQTQSLWSTAWSHWSDVLGNRDLASPLTFQLILCQEDTGLQLCMFRTDIDANIFIDVREVDRDTLEPILFLLQSPDIEVQRAASAALGNLAVNSMFEPYLLSYWNSCWLLHSGE